MVDQRVQSASIGSAILAVGTLMVAVSILDLVSNLWPFAPGSIEWRYGAVGILSGFAVTPLLGLVLVMIGAQLRLNGALVKLVAYLCLLLAVVLGVGLVVFLLDGLQIRQLAPDERRAVTARAVGIAAVRLVAGIASLGVVARAGLQLAKTARRGSKSADPIVGR